MPNGRDLGMQVSGDSSADINMTLQAGGEGPAANAEAWAVGERHGVPVESSDPTYHNNAKYYAGLVEGAAQDAAAAQQAAEDAEAWAIGKRDGTDVTSGDEAYHNNSKYYKEQAAASALAAGQAQSAAEATLTKQPKIQNGTWWIWDATNSVYVDTHVKSTGDAWHIVKTYASVAAMNADYSGTDTDIGDYVMVVNSVEDPDNAKVYIKGSSAWEFVVDMSGATGIQGDPGANAYVHIRYAANQPTQDSDMTTQPRSWIGICSNNSATAPTTYTSYTWYQFRGRSLASFGIDGQYRFSYTYTDGTGGATDSILPVIRTATKDAEAWAVGTKDGTAVESTDDTYHNNSKYYAEQAAGQVQQINNASAKIDNMDAIATGLAAGSSPTVAVTEVDGHKRISFGIPTGATGATGLTPHLTIGTVTDLPHGSTPSATLSGTDENPVLNLGLVHGPSGNESIDDTAGIGDDDLVFSADKVTKELNKKATVIEETISTPAEVMTIPDGAGGLPMALTVGIEPVQDLHGQDNPWPAGCGKNILDATDIEGTTSGLTFSLVNNPSFTISGTFSSGVYRYVNGALKLKPSTQYTVSGALAAIRIRVREYDSNGNLLETTESSGTTTFTTNAQTDYADVYVIVHGLSSTTTIYPMIEEGSSASDFVPYSNICPISGWTGAKICVSGKNLLDNNNASSINGVISTAPHKIEANENAKTVYIPCKENTEYVISKTKGNRFVVACTEELPAVGVTTSQEEVINTSATSYAITTGARAKYLCVYCYFSSADTLTYQEILGSMQIEFGSAATIQEPFVSNKQYSITFPGAAGTVYGGTLDVTSGVLTVDMEYVNAANLSWVFNKNTDDGKATVAFVTINPGKYQSRTGLSNVFKYTSNSALDWGAYDKNSFATTGDSINYLIAVLPTPSMTYSQITQWMSDNNVVFCLKLKNPQTYQLTQTEVTTLLGINNIWADTGDVLSVTYHADTKLYVDQQIADKISASQRLMELIVTANHEDEMKATKAYSTGDLLIVNGTLYKATTSIANGANLTVNTNVTATTVAAELAALA